MLTIITSLLTIIFSGLVATIISASLTNRKEKRVLQRQKIEEIYTDSSEWIKDASSVFLQFLPVALGRLDYNKALDEQISSFKSSTGEHHIKMQMNIFMYERSLLPAFRLMENELEKLQRVKAQFRNEFDQDGTTSTFGKAYRDQSLLFSKASETLKESIVKRGTQLADETGDCFARRFLSRKSKTSLKVS